MKRIFLLMFCPAVVLVAGTLQGTLDPVPSTVPAMSVLDMRFSHSGVYTNPWEALTMRAEFRSPEGDTLRTGGFYYNTGEWRFRFCPPVAGAWRWSVVVSSGADTFRQSGQFNAPAGIRKGFIKVHPDNPRRLAFADNTVFFPSGLQCCWGSNMVFRVDTAPAPTVSARAYVDSFANSGYNIYRIGFGNCAIDPVDSLLTTGNRYKILESICYDSLMGYLHDAGFRIIANPCLDCDFWVDQVGDTAKMAAVHRYIDYILNRWAAYVDLLEINNEPYGAGDMPLEWLRPVMTHMRASDPYRHLIGQDLMPTRFCTDSNYVKLFDVLMPHYYYDGSVLTQDQQTAYNLRVARFNSEKHKVMPVIMGEQGYNADSTFHAMSPRKQRIRHWTAFFSEAALVAWYQIPIRR